jgi:hypothetical protein
MAHSLRYRLAASLLAACSLAPALAVAAPPGGAYDSLHVLEPLAPDALHPQARALTEAVKARVQASPLYALGNTDFSLFVLVAPCERSPFGPDGEPLEPSPRCLERVGESLGEKILRQRSPFVWGVLRRAPGASHRLVTRIHLWREGQSDVVIERTFDEGLVDPTAPALVDLADDLVGRLLYGTENVGTVRVLAGPGLEGDVYADNELKGRIAPGARRELTVARGEHVFDVRQGDRVRAVIGPAPSEVRLDAPAAATESVRALAPSPAAAAHPARASHARAAAPYVIAGVGAAALVASGAFFAARLSARTEIAEYCHSVACPSSQSDAVARSKLYGVLAPTALGIGLVGVAAGAWLYFDGRDADAKRPVSAVLVPIERGAAASVSGAFL